MISPARALPVVLTPGFLDNVRILNPLAAYLRERGVRAYPLSPQPSNGTVAIDALAAQLARMIDHALGPTQPFIFFGFSMGGLIGRYYLQRLSGAARIPRLITLATPHRGTLTSRLLPWLPALAQMRPGSDFLADLNADLTPLRRIEFAAYWTPFDLSVTPPTRSYLPGLPARGVLSPLHATLPLDPWVVRRVGQALCAPVAAVDAL
jgi:triacylglycerol lipase